MVTQHTHTQVTATDTDTDTHMLATDTLATQYTDRCDVHASQSVTNNACTSAHTKKDVIDKMQTLL